MRYFAGLFMALLQPVQDPFLAAAELLRKAAAPYEVPEPAPAVTTADRRAVRRFMSLSSREFEVILADFRSGVEKGLRLHELLRRQA